MREFDLRQRPTVVSLSKKLSSLLNMDWSKVTDSRVFRHNRTYINLYRQTRKTMKIKRLRLKRTLSTNTQNMQYLKNLCWNMYIIKILFLYIEVSIYYVSIWYIFGKISTKFLLHFVGNSLNKPYSIS